MMAGKFYWLISITSESVRVSLVASDSSDVKSLGPETAWDRHLPDSLIRAVDTSLSAALADYQLPPDAEPDDCAFIIPPLWVGEDGRIYPDVLKNLEKLCKELKFHPLGFIGDDDAFIESYNHADSFPGSYILLNLLSNRFFLSLVYLGHIQKRISQDFEGDFSVNLLETTLVELNFPRALPPKIIIIGNYTNSLIEDINNYNWVNPNRTETFLHLPDVVTITPADLQQLFSLTIHHQLSPLSPPASLAETTPTPLPLNDDLPDQSAVSPPSADHSSLSVEDMSVPPLPPLTQVQAADLGFNSDTSSPPPLLSSDILAETESNFVEVSRPSFKHHFPYFWLLPLLLLPLIPLLPLFLTRAEVIVYLNPVEFQDSFTTTLDPHAASSTIDLISVSQKSLNLSVSASGPTSGKKEIGEKARGEVVIFNKLDTIQNLNKGLIFSDTDGHKFELTGNLQVPGSSYNLDAGVIVLGQVKTSLVAVDIGPESNLAANTQLNSTNPNFIIRVTSGLTGGTKELVSVVSAEDRSRLLETARQDLQNQAKSQIQADSAPGLTIFDATAFFSGQKTDFSREVGEVTDSLSLNLQSQVSFLYIDTAAKSQILSLWRQKTQKLSGLDPNSLSLDLSFAPKDLTATKSTGTLTISGRGNPQIDTTALRSQLAFRTDQEVKKIVAALPRFYNYQIKNNFNFINLFHRLPKNPDKITIVTKN